MLKVYFTDYQSPSSMYKKLSKAKGVENEIRVNLIKKVLTKFKKIIENTPRDDDATKV